MKAFDKYVKSLEKLYFNVTQRASLESLSGEVSAALDGEPARQLRHLIPLTKLRAAGAFFTGSELATKAAALILPSITSTSRILDPACGAGDLLIACAKNLPTSSSFQATVAQWSRCLMGRDLQPEFIAAARYRLALTALSRGRWDTTKGKVEDTSVFSQVVVGCGLRDSDAIGGATHIIINPPFNLIPAPKKCEWAGGNVSAAAVFLDEYVQRAMSGTRIAAILPDVLRSGERYRRWRDRISSRVRIVSIDLLGRFDRLTDIDIFLVNLMVTGNHEGRYDRWQHSVSRVGEKVGDRFEVSVGPVVAYREPHRGPWRPYIHARNVPAWEKLKELRERRRFRGPVYASPFVVVRRTSRVGDRHRAVGTLITGNTTVAVENHLLVLRPKDGRLASCKRLLELLRSPKTDEWLDCRIRCRHLTVVALRQLPLWKEGV